MFFGQKRIYLDYASGTPVLKEAREAYLAALEHFGNPGSMHGEGVRAEAILSEAREKVAAHLAVKARDIVFLSGGSEANALALLGSAAQWEKDGIPLHSVHAVVSAIEHASTLACFGELERRGVSVAYLPPNAKGIITQDTLASALTPETRLVSIGLANGEIGIVQPLSALSRVILEHEAAHGTSVTFHTDAGQAPLYRASQPHSLGVDLMTLDAGKMYAPRGVGALFVGERARIAPLILGGGQERALRAGTENVAGVAAFAAALSTLAGERKAEEKRVAAARDVLLTALSKGIPDLVVNGAIEHSLPHILNVSIIGVSTEYLTLALDAEGIAVSTKSACKEGEESRSHVVEALLIRGGEDSWRPAHTLRFSLGRHTTEKDAARAGERVVRIVSRLRTEKSMSRSAKSTS